MIAGEALMGLVVASFAVLEIGLPEFFKVPSYFIGVGVLALMAINMISMPMANAGHPDEPAPAAVIWPRRQVARRARDISTVRIADAGLMAVKMIAMPIANGGHSKWPAPMAAVIWPRHHLP